MYHAIYVLEDDTLTLCIPDKEMDRPTDFELRDGDRKERFVYKRTKDYTEEDKEKLQGSWKMVSLDSELDKFNELRNMEVTFTFRADTCVVSDGKQQSEMTFKLDGSSYPRSIDLINKTGDFRCGVYEMQDDKLRICLQEVPNITLRPMYFVGHGTEVLFVFERKK